MKEPREGDVVLDTRMEPWEVTSVDGEMVRCSRMGWPTKRRRFKLADLEDVETGMWQEMVRR